MKNHKKSIKYLLFLLTLFFVLSLSQVMVFAQDNPISFPSLDINIGTADTPQATVSTIQMLMILTIITLSPYILILFTCFTRLIISFSFLRTALGTQQMPPNQILVGLSLFLTLFIMGPVFNKINDNAFQPYSSGQISQEQFFTEAMSPIREFMFEQVEEKDLILFTELANIESYVNQDQIPNRVLIPAFILGEITKGFKIGFLLYIPFIVIDMIVASTLMAMGMMMLPPALIAAPFKILLFIVVDGWNLIVENLIKTFYV